MCHCEIFVPLVIRLAGWTPQQCCGPFHHHWLPVPLWVWRRAYCTFNEHLGERPTPETLLCCTPAPHRALQERLRFSLRILVKTRPPNVSQSQWNNAVHINTLSLLYIYLFIFFCSMCRCRFLRETDRRKNGMHFPKLYYPELYLLEGGYKAFFKDYQVTCMDCCLHNHTILFVRKPGFWVKGCFS